MTAQADINYCGMLQMLRQLIARGTCTYQEAEKIAARIAAQTGAEIILPL